MFEWINLKDEKPDEYTEVLVETNINGDDWRHHFVASYDHKEKEWRLNLHFQGSKSPYIAVCHKALKSDRWCIIDPPHFYSAIPEL